MILLNALDAEFAVSVVAKATLVLAAVALAQVALRRASAAIRHLLWVLALATLPLLPALSLALPAWTVPVERLSAPPVAPEAAIGEVAAAPAVSGVRLFPVGEPARAPAPARGPADPGTGRYAVLSLWAVYLAMAALLAARVAAEWVRMRRLRRESEPVREPEWTALFVDLTRQMGVRKEVALVRSDRSRVPLTWGTRAPVVLLPVDADEWPRDRRRAVLLHELAHVARRDSLAQTLGSLVCALYWFHPGVWWAARRSRVERELACDDEVLRAGTEPHEYAGHLLEIARHGWGPAPSLGLSMARPSQLEARMLAILDPRRRRSAPARSTTGILAGAAIALLLAISTGGVAEGRVLDLSSRGAPASPVDPGATPGESRMGPAHAPVQAPALGVGEPGVDEAVPPAIQDADSVVLVSRDGALRVVLERDAIRVRVSEDVYRQLTGEAADASNENGFLGVGPSGSAARYLASSVNRSIGLYNLRDVLYRDGSLLLVRRDAPEPPLPPSAGSRSGVYTIERMGLEPAQVEPFLRAARQRIELWSAVAGRVTMPGAAEEADLQTWAETMRAQVATVQAAERAIAQQSRPGIMWSTVEPWLANEEIRVANGTRRMEFTVALDRVKRAWRLLEARRTLEPDLATLESSPQAQAFRDAMEAYIRILEEAP